MELENLSEKDCEPTGVVTSSETGSYRSVVVHYRSKSDPSKSYDVKGPTIQMAST